MEITLETPLDMHLHFREGDMLKTVAPLSAEHFAGGVIMPNLITPVDSLELVQKYKKEIESVCGNDSFTPYMTLFFRSYSKEELLAAKEHIIGIKLYPAGITTQSESGVSDFDTIGPTIHLMEELGIPLLVHGETDGFVMDREKEFLTTYRWLAENFPKLSIIMEHITTADSLSLVDRYPNVAATITLHHLMLTLDDVVGGLMQPHLFCKPIAKTPADLKALRQAVFQGHPRLFFGSDSAPHPRDKKECCGCAAGIFSSPVALPALVQLFDVANQLDKLQDFVSRNARRFYGIQPPPKNITLRRQEWQVPEQYGTVTPFMAGETMCWQVTEIMNR